jgi:hypothetical protein
VGSWLRPFPKDAPATPDDALEAGFTAPPPLVYGLVYKGLGAIVKNSRPPRLSCKLQENKRADERTRTADLLQLRVCLRTF